MTSKRILLVDDSQETRSFVADKILAPEGYEVITAPNGDEALTITRTMRPDLIVADYQMPDMTGLDLLATLKAEGSNVPFILITAEGSEALAVRALRLGVRDYVIKPFEIDAFLEAIDRVLAADQGTNFAQKITEPGILGAILWGISEVFLITDEQNNVLFFNYAAREKLKIEGNDVLGMPITSVIKHPGVLELFEAEHTEERHHEIEIGEKNVLSAHQTLIKGLGYVTLMHDITHLKERDRAKSDFITAISHDLRSPLTTILGYVELLQRVGSLSEQQQKFTENILFSVHSITALLADMMEINKIESGFEINFEPTHMEIILRYASETHRSTLEAKQQVLTIDMPPHPTPVLGNPIRLKQLVSNLLQNAIKYTPEKGTIAMRLYEDGGFSILQVKDNGIGIPIDDQGHIWDKFYRTEEASKNYDGTGLGLSIVKSIVDTHNGRIWVESAPQTGSTFTVMLPLQTA